MLKQRQISDIIISIHINKHQLHNINDTVKLILEKYIADTHMRINTHAPQIFKSTYSV
jgi:hypothetical protein